MKRNHIILVLSLFLLANILVSCGDIVSIDLWDDDDEYSGPAVTFILRVEVEPIPVLVGENLTVTCVIQDSLSQDFTFEWRPNNKTSETVKTKTNSYTFKSPEEPGRYIGIVSVDSENRHGHAVSRGFSYTVVEATDDT